MKFLIFIFIFGISSQNFLRKNKEEKNLFSICFPMNSPNQNNINDINIICSNNNCFGTINNTNDNIFININAQCNHKGCKIIKENICTIEICENCFNITLICFNGKSLVVNKIIMITEEIITKIIT